MLLPAGGFTLILVPVPTDVPPQDPSYQTQIAPVPKEPPETVNVFCVPKQVPSFITAIFAGAVDSLLTFTASVLAELVPQEFVAVTEIVPDVPVPELTVMLFVDDVPVQPDGKVQEYDVAVGSLATIYVSETPGQT